MNTKIKKIDANKIDMQIIEEAGEILKRGGLVAFPTETVYGLGADALDEKAARKIYAAKGRPSDNPLIVHIAEVRALDRIATDIPIKVEELAYYFWPGPLTMILKKSEEVPYETTGGLDTASPECDCPGADSCGRRICVRSQCKYIRAPQPHEG